MLIFHYIIVDVIYSLLLHVRVYKSKNNMRSITSALSTEGQCYHHMLSICVLSVGERPDRIRLALREPKGFESAPWPSKCVHHNTRLLIGLKTWLLIGQSTLAILVHFVTQRDNSKFQCFKCKCKTCWEVFFSLQIFYNMQDLHVSSVLLLFDVLKKPSKNATEQLVKWNTLLYSQSIPTRVG